MTLAIPIIDPNKCTGCGECVDKCPSLAVTIVNGKAVILRAEDCSYCADCETVCPTGAISCPLEIVIGNQ